MKINRSPSGFTLIELLAAIVVIGICGSGLLAAFAMTIGRNEAQPYDLTAGEALVREGLEKILSDRRNPTIGFSGFSFPDDESTDCYTLWDEPNLTGGYTRTTTVCTWPANPDRDNFLQVSVVVTRGGRTIGKASCLLANS
jgi:prepilin-type N-terminal cleavage/methylation domain-containing protein